MNGGVLSKQLSTNVFFSESCENIVELHTVSAILALVDFKWLWTLDTSNETMTMAQIWSAKSRTFLVAASCLTAEIDRSQKRKITKQPIMHGEASTAFAEFALFACRMNEGQILAFRQ